MRRIRRCTACFGGYNETEIVDKDGNPTGGLDRSLCVICGGKGVVAIGLPADKADDGDSAA